MWGCVCWRVRSWVSFIRDAAVWFGIFCAAVKFGIFCAAVWIGMVGDVF